MPIVLQFTDTHLTQDPSGTLKGVVTRDSLNACVALAIEKGLNDKAEHVLLTGDLSHDASEKSYTALQEIMSPLKLPISALPGNHDQVLPMKQYLHHTWLSGEASVCEWQIILLNSAVADKEHGYIEADDIQRAYEILARTEKSNVLICLHHQPVPVGSDWLDNIMLQNSEEFFRLVESSNKIKGIVFGHVHQSFEGQHNNVKIIGSPSTCIQFQENSREFGLDNIAPAFRMINLHDDGTIDTELFYIDTMPALDANESY